jgi:hypothetical protein
MLTSLTRIFANWPLSTAFAHLEVKCHNCGWRIEPVQVQRILRTMKIALLGDVYLSDGSVMASSGGDRCDIFANVQSRIGAGTFLVGNVEFAISNRDSPFYYKWAILCTPPAIVEKLKPLSVAVLANNHAGDAGLEGLEDTFVNLQQAGIGSVGYGKTLEQALEPCLLERDGSTVALVALNCLTTNGQCIATPTSPGVALLSVQTLRRAIDNARKKSNVVIAILHWGCEQTPYPVPDQIRLGRLAIDAGAHAVVGCHAHVIQTFERYRDRWIFHGLGNFFFDPVDARLFEDRRLVAKTRIDHGPRNRESLVPVFSIESGELRLADLFVTRWQSGQVPVVVDVSKATIDVRVINARLRKWSGRHTRRIRDGSELKFRSTLSNDVVTYSYVDPPIRSESPFLSVAAGACRRARRLLERILVRTAVQAAQTSPGRAPKIPDDPN